MGKHQQQLLMQQQQQQHQNQQITGYHSIPVSSSHLLTLQNQSQNQNFNNTLTKSSQNPYQPPNQPINNQNLLGEAPHQNNIHLGHALLQPTFSYNSHHTTNSGLGSKIISTQ